MKKSIGAQTMPLPAPVWLVGTYDAAGKANVMTASWTGICCSKPPCVYVSLQKPRYSYGSIVARQAFTISVPSVDQAVIADYCGIVSGRDEDKFAGAGITAVNSDLVDAPYVGECPVVMECKLRHTIELGSHTQFIGEVLDVKVEESALVSEGRVDTGKLGVFAFIGGDYRRVDEILGKSFSIGRELKK